MSRSYSGSIIDPAPDPAEQTSPPPAGPSRRLTLADAACIGPLLLAPVFYLAFLPFAVSNLSLHPVLLEALRGSIPSMVTAGAFARVGRAPVPVVFTAPLLGLMVFDPFTWWAGRRYGHGLLGLYARQGRRQRRQVERGEQLFARWGGWTLVFAYYIPVIPNAAIYFAAGVSRMSLVRFLVLDLAGSLLWSTLVVSLGYAVGQRAIDLADLVSRYALYVSIALVAGTIAYSVWRQRRDG